VSQNNYPQQFVRDLYLAFLRHEPDEKGWQWWTEQVGAQRQNKQAVMNDFANTLVCEETAKTLYRETFWLIGDHLGTPRMIAERTGKAEGIKRRDFLPFGEELTIGGRSDLPSYAPASPRQSFTGYEKDVETGLDYAQARYYAGGMGRFASCDPYNIVMERQFATNSKETNAQFVTYLSNSQRWNRYHYALNNPLLYTDPKGEDVTIYYRPAKPGEGSKEDQGHILIYVRNDETGESAYFDYMINGGAEELRSGNYLSKLNGVDQKRIDEHASLSIETNAQQETAMLNAIKEAQKSLPDYHVSFSEAWNRTESTCTSMSKDILAKGGLDLGNVGMRSPRNVWEAAFRKYAVGEKYESLSPGSATNQAKIGGNFRILIPSAGKEYGSDPRGQARKLDTKAVNNDKNLLYRGGKLVREEKRN
jgi:RHS repeat-associated protein